MSRNVISVDKLGKEYIIGSRESGNETFREMLASAAAAPFRRLRRLSGQVDPEERIWALKDVSLEVKEGEVFGIIGRNGAGKSTLLKILCRITAPTEGSIKIRGRVSSLLEVGTGFHPELTGRENIYLNGAILGMSRAEINRKFDEIVDFSGVEKFLDTPVKRYSSGMSVRLAFAVAAHLEPEILIVDEVLAVGDAQFQNKCLGKMQDATRSGRTVLFVSHNLDAIKLLCDRAILLEAGGVKCIAPATDVIVGYLSQEVPRKVATFPENPQKPSIIRVEVDEAELLNGNLIVGIEFASPYVISPIPGLAIYDESARPIYGSNTRTHPPDLKASLSSGTICFEACDLPIREGKYLLSLWLSDWHHNYDERPHALLLNFRPRNPPVDQSGVTGPLNWLGHWRVEAPST